MKTKLAKLLLLSLICFSVSFIFGCSSRRYVKCTTSCTPKASGILIVVTAETEPDAIEGANQAAENYCGSTFTKGKYIVISGPTVTFIGKTEKPQEGWSGAAAGIAKLAFRAKDDHSNDYKCELIIQCNK